MNIARSLRTEWQAGRWDWRRLTTVSRVAGVGSGSAWWIGGEVQWVLSKKAPTTGSVWCGPAHSLVPVLVFPWY